MEGKSGLLPCDSKTSKQRRVKCLRKWVQNFNTSNSDTTISNYYTTEVVELVNDKDIAACAVALVIASARKGVISLCANVARILKENAKLEQKLQYYTTKCKQEEDSSLVNDYKTSLVSSHKLNIDTRSSQGSNDDEKEDDDGPSWRKLESVAFPDTLSKKLDNVIVTTAVVHYPADVAEPDIDVSDEAIPDCTDQCAEQSLLKNKPVETFQTSNRCPDDVEQCRMRLESIDELSPLNLQPKDESTKKLYRDVGASTDFVTVDDLCACSDLWKEKYLNSCQRIEQLENELKVLRGGSDSDNGKPQCENCGAPREANVASGHQDSHGCKFSGYRGRAEREEEEDTDSPPSWLSALMRQRGTPILAPSPFLGCRCTRCEVTFQEMLLTNRDDTEVFQLMSKGKPLLSLGDRVMIPGDYIGLVSYVGHLDGIGMLSAVFVGVTLNQPKGNSDGFFMNKRYFHCSRNHGLFLPINNILFVVGLAENIQSSVQKRPSYSLQERHRYC